VDDTEPREAPTRPRAVHWIIFFHGISSFCLGLVFPFTAIYLSGEPGVGTGGVALYYGLSGAANLVVALVLATGLVRPPRVALGVFGNLLSCGGFLVLAAVDSVGGMPLVVTAGLANGAGMGCFLAAIIPIVNSLVDDEDRRRIFARRYQVLNATLASGSLVAGLLVVAMSREAIRYLMLVNALGYLPLAATLLWHRRLTRARELARRDRTATGDDGSRGPARMPIALLLKASLAVSLVQLGVFLFGYSQFEVTMPLVADDLLRVSLGWVSVLIAVNVCVIVVAQSLVTRLLQPRAEAVGLRVAIGLWTGGYLLAGLTALAPTPVALAGLVAYAVLFALGECAYSCSYHPWLISRVPEQELTRANALSNSMMGIGLFAGPSVGVALVASGSATTVWLALAALCAVVSLGTVRLRRPVRPRPGPPGSPPGPGAPPDGRDRALTA
jgi:MFS family permease